MSKYTKKICSAVVAVIMLTSLIAGCSSGDKSSSPAETTTTTTVTTTTATSSTTTPTGTDMDMDTDSPDADTDGGTLKSIFESAESSVEWTALMDVADPAIAKDLGFDLNNDNYEEISIKQAAISAAFAEMVIIKAKDVDAAVKDLEARKEKMSADSFYPAHQEEAKNAIVGKHGNYAYLIGHSEGAKVEQAIKDAIDKL